MNDEDKTARVIVDHALRVHKALGPGLLESVYEVVLADSLSKAGHHVERQRPIAIRYEGTTFDAGFKADLLVDRSVIVELKSVEALAAVHKKQLLTYLKLSNLRLGLLINFGSEYLKNNIVRLANKLPEPSRSLRPLRETKGNRS